jgi:hypothetical protein
MRSQGVLVKVAPKRAAGFHIPHESGTRANIFEALRQLHVKRKEMYEKGQPVINNPGMEWGKSEILKVENYE